MTHDYTETLYANLFNVLNELSEYESPELIFDRIVEDFAMSAEHHMSKADTFKSMLDTFRHDNPAETIPDTLEEVELQSPNDMRFAMNDLSEINRELLLEDRNNLMEFLKSANFPDTI
jgi:hypothetical protein